MVTLQNRLVPETHKWLECQGVCVIFNAMKSGGGEARIVGGAVRDALLGREVMDIDFAVNLPSETVMQLLRQQGIKVVPTGLAHGTVTAVIEGRGYEITTLRRDVRTDGRHATIAYTNDWQEDAARRDFTFNAMYLDESGSIEDYFDGDADLKTLCIRFIGNPEARIHEDYLRVLRAFRFMAQLASVEHPAFIEEKSLAACAAGAYGLPTLSAERVWHEIRLMLSADDPSAAFVLMNGHKILREILPQASNVERLRALVRSEQQCGVTPAPLRRLAALWEGPCGSALTHLRFSRRERELFCALSTGLFAPDEPVSVLSVRQKLYAYGPAYVRDALLLASCEHPLPLINLLALCEAWEDPKFPLKGRDFLKMGLTQGAQMGKIMRMAEQWWRERDFKPSRQDCLEQAHILVHATLEET